MVSFCCFCSSCCQHQHQHQQQGCSLSLSFVSSTGMIGKSSAQQHQQQQNRSLLLLYSVFILQDLLRISAMVVVFVVVVFFVFVFVSDITVMNIYYTVLCSRFKIDAFQIKKISSPISNYVSARASFLALKLI